MLNTEKNVSRALLAIAIVAIIILSVIPLNIPKIPIKTQALVSIDNLPSDIYSAGFNYLFILFAYQHYDYDANEPVYIFKIYYRDYYADPVGSTPYNITFSPDRSWEDSASARNVGNYPYMRLYLIVPDIGNQRIYLYLYDNSFSLIASTYFTTPGIYPIISKFEISSKVNLSGVLAYIGRGSFAVSGSCASANSNNRAYIYDRLHTIHESAGSNIPSDIQNYLFYNEWCEQYRLIKAFFNYPDYVTPTTTTTTNTTTTTTTTTTYSYNPCIADQYNISYICKALVTEDRYGFSYVVIDYNASASYKPLLIHYITSDGELYQFVAYDFIALYYYNKTMVSNYAYLHFLGYQIYYYAIDPSFNPTNLYVFPYRGSIMVLISNGTHYYYDTVANSYGTVYISTYYIVNAVAYENSPELNISQVSIYMVRKISPPTFSQDFGNLTSVNIICPDRLFQPPDIPVFGALLDALSKGLAFAYCRLIEFIKSLLPEWLRNLINGVTGSIGLVLDVIGIGLQYISIAITVVSIGITVGALGLLIYNPPMFFDIVFGLTERTYRLLRSIITLFIPGKE